MNKKIIIALTILFCFTAKVNFAQLFPASKTINSYESSYGYINSAGKIIVPFTYKAAYEFSDSVGMVSGKEYKVGYVNALGKLFIPCKYDDGYSFNNGYALVGLGEKGFLIDKKGKEYPITNLELSYNNYFSEGLVIVENAERKKGYANLKNELVIPFQFDAAVPFSEGYAIVKERYTYFLMDKMGNKKEINGFKVLNLTDGLICVQKVDQKWGAYNTKMEVVIDFIYDDLSEFKNGYAQFELNGKVGVINTKGEVVLPATYFRIHSFSENRMMVQNNYSSATMLDENFKVVKEFSNIYTSYSAELCFKNGITTMFYEVGPTASAKDENVQKFGGISKTYINMKGETIWKEEPYYTCFPEGSKVTMADFSKKEIQNMKAGDEILTFNQQTNHYETTKVIRLEKHQGNFELIEITCTTNSNLTASISDKIAVTNKQITATPNHPVLTQSGIKLMDDISTKDVLFVWSDDLQSFEALPVTSVTYKESTNTVYNLKTEAKNYVINSMVMMMK